MKTLLPAEDMSLIKLTDKTAFHGVGHPGYYTFDGPPQFELGTSGRIAKMTADYLAFFPDGEELIVPKDFETDFASVPRLFWSIIPPWGPYFPAAIVHDFLYERGMMNGRSVTRKEADVIFHQILKQLHVEYELDDDPETTLPLWKVQTMFIAVRIGGLRAWRRSRSRDRARIKFLYERISEAEE